MVPTALVGGCERWASAVAAGEMVPLVQVSGQADVPDNVIRLAVRNGIGDVKVLASDAKDVGVEADVRIRESRAAGAVAGGFADHVTISVAGDTITVANAHLDQPDKDDWAMDLTLRLPGRLAAQVETGVGDIAITGTRSDLRLDTGVGDVKVRAPAAGAVDVTSGVGDLDIELAEVTGAIAAETGPGDVGLAVTAAAPKADVRLESGVGSITLKIPPGSPGAFTCTAGVGTVTISGHEGLETTKSGTSARAEGRLGEGGPRYTLETGVGSIVIE